MVVPSAQSAGSSGNAPAAAPAASAASGGGAPGAGGGAETTDFAKLFQSTQQQLQQSQQQLKRYNDELSTVKSQATKDAEVLNRLRQAFNPDQGNAPNPSDHYTSQMDYYLQAALEAERAGSPMPLTANLATQFFQSQIQSEQDKTNLQKTIVEMQKQLKMATDPGQQIDIMAYAAMDTHVQNAINTIFGADERFAMQKNSQFDAITQQIGTEIKDLKKNDPAAWDQIRRNPAKMQRMVTYFVEQNMPPRARQIIEQERIMNQPQSVSDLMEAFREAQIAYKDDPVQSAKVQKAIREEILATKASARRQPQGQSTSRMYGRAG